MNTFSPFLLVNVEYDRMFYTFSTDKTITGSYEEIQSGDLKDIEDIVLNRAVELEISDFDEKYLPLEAIRLSGRTVSINPLIHKVFLMNSEDYHQYDIKYRTGFVPCLEEYGDWIKTGNQTCSSLFICDRIEKGKVFCVAMPYQYGYHKKHNNENVYFSVGSVAIGKTVSAKIIAPFEYEEVSSYPIVAVKF